MQNLTESPKYGIIKGSCQKKEIDKTMKKLINKLVFRKLTYVLLVTMAVIGVIFITAKMYPNIKLSHKEKADRQIPAYSPPDFSFHQSHHRWIPR